ncbi:MAG TPA: bacillithiol biosynthesis cysteine-adding enzyme BshC [Candidatus Acidoferrales bacterium]|nr:bacillithiol biosynthesis cysteine-adding enzyme BshC [Candidatus Acidoferrales bacterium]
MECHCIPNREIPHTTRLFSAFSDEFSKVAEFYAHTPDEAGVRAAAKKVRLDAAIRSGVANVLREQNRQFGGGEAVARNIGRLAEGAAAIVTGQQVGLFGGPAYSIYKALSAIAWATKLTRAGVEAVPVFWLATEDHDLAEVNHVFVHGKQGLAKIELSQADEFTGRSVGRIPLGIMAVAAAEHAAQLLEGPASKEIAEALSLSYRAQETYGGAFAKLFARLFGNKGLILLDPLDRRLHELARPIYRRAAEESETLAEELLARGKLLDRRGYHAQVKVTSQSTLLFLDAEGKRQAVRRRNGGFLAGEKKLSAAELLGQIERHQENFSASVLLRPIVQDSLLPTAAYIGGPAEVAYMAQAQIVYERILGRMPAILPRPSFTLVEPETARLLKKYGLEFGDILRGRQHVRRQMEREYLPRGLATRFSRDDKALRKILKGYAKPLGTLDKTLVGALGTAERKMMCQFEKLREKAGRAQNFRTGVLDRHEEQIMNSLLPHHDLQERTLSLLPILARQGEELFEKLLTMMSKPCAGHHVVFV